MPSLTSRTRPGAETALSRKPTPSPAKAKTASRKRAHNGLSKGAKPGAPVEITEAVGYIRVSTEEQAEGGLSLETQRSRITAYADMMGWQMVKVFEDAGISGKTLDRPSLHSALRSLQPGRAMIVFKLDRLTRSVKHIYELVETIDSTGGNWVSVMEQIDTSSATGRLMLGLIVQLSQWERETIAERTATVLADKKKRRERLGTTPLGYRTIETESGGKKLEADPEEQETVRLARELRTGGLSFRRIAAILCEAGRSTKRGGKWEAATVARLIQTRYVETLEPKN